MRRHRLLTDALREIKKTMSRFLSLFLLSALAVAFLAGLRTTAPDMERTADAYYDAHKLMDLHVLSTLGLTDEDIAFLGSQEGISAAEGGYSADALLHTEENDSVLKVLSLSPNDVNAPELLEGRLPEHDWECVVEPKLLTESGLKIGDYLPMDTGSGDFEDALKFRDYIIVGTVHSPLYIYIERGTSSLGTGSVDAFVLLPEGGFTMEFYTDAYLSAAGAAPLYCYDDAYEDQLEALTDRLEPLGDQRAALRYDQVVGDANEELADAQKEFDDAERDANQELSDARKELDDGWAEYGDGIHTLATETADAKRKIADAEQELPDALMELQDGEVEYQDGVKTLEDGKLDYADGVKKLADGQKEYDDGYRDLLDGEQEYADSVKKLDDGQKEYNDGYFEYRAGLDALQAGAKELDKAKRQLDDASAQLDAGSAELAAGQNQYNQLKLLLTDLQTKLGGVQGALAAKNLLPLPDPTDPAALAAFAGALAAEAAGNSAGFVADLTLPLHQIVAALQAQLDPSSPEHAQLAALLGGLPADTASLGGLLALPGGAGVQALTGGILGGLGAASAGLSNMTAALDAAQKQLAAGSDALSSGSAQYSEGLREYKKARLEFDDSVGKLQDAKKELDDAQAELDDGYGKLADGRRELDDGWTDLDAAKLELIDGKAELLDAEKEIADGEIEVADARKKLDDGWLEYNDGLAELADAKQKLPREIAKAQKELDDALIELNDGEIEYADGKAEADQELSDARKKLNDARREIAKIEDCEWYVLGRNTNMGYVSFQQDAERMGNLANVFPLIFFLVAALVCLTTMTRMVEEQRVQIGGMKALGYSKVAIALKYVGYGFLASFLGGVTGLAVGVFLIPSIIFTAWKILYTVGDLIVPFQPMISIVSVGAAVLCVTGTALGACFTTLASVPAELMRPRTPKPGKRVLLEHLPALWNRLTFTWKVTVRNLFRYKKRFWMTVVGIGGCTALIITGFGLRNSIYDVLDKQYDKISPYSSQVSLADDVTPDELQEISRQLDREKTVTEWTPCYTTTITAESPARTMDVALFAVEDDAAFDDFIHLRHRLDNDPVTLPDNGVVLTEKLGEMLDLKVGDSIVLDGDKRVTATIADFTENYVYHYVYLSEAYYEQLFGTPPDTNMILTQYSEDAVPGDISANLIALSGVTSVGLIQESRDTFTKSMQSVDYAVIIVTISAAALAFVVLYNLTNINITERMRELATLKVLGFYNGELSSYVYRENIFLTLFGILMGLFMGKFLHQWLVLTVEVDMVMFGRTARLSSYLYAAGLTALFSFLVNLAARKKLKKIDMVESLKTVE